MSVIKVGVISCSGEECLGGTISRLATRKVLEELTFIDTVTLCLPLYLAGGKEERKCECSAKRRKGDMNESKVNPAGA